METPVMPTIFRLQETDGSNFSIVNGPSPESRFLCILEEAAQLEKCAACAPAEVRAPVGSGAQVEARFALEVEAAGIVNVGSFAASAVIIEVRAVMSPARSDSGGKLPMRDHEIQA